MKYSKISFVIPCYRSEATIEGVVREIIDEMTGLREFDYEIILVNDSSPDGVWNVISDLSKTDERIIGINLAKNFGQANALLAGYSLCSGDIVVSLDDDGQAPLDGLKKLIMPIIENKYDAVFSETPRIKQTLFRRLASDFNAFTAEVMLSKPKNFHPSSFWACKLFVAKSICECKNIFPYILGLVLKVTNSIGGIVLQQRERAYGKSTYNLAKLLKLWINGYTAYTIIPLRVTSISGVVCASVGLIYALILIIKKIVGIPVMVGYSSLMSVMLIIGGLILLGLGIIGEYLGRTYMSANDLPSYVIRETTKENNEDV